MRHSGGRRAAVRVAAAGRRLRMSIRRQSAGAVGCGANHYGGALVYGGRQQAVENRPLVSQAGNEPQEPIVFAIYGGGGIMSRTRRYAETSIMSHPTRHIRRCSSGGAGRQQ